MPLGWLSIKYVNEMVAGGMISTPSFIKIGSGIQMLLLGGVGGSYVPMHSLIHSKI